MLTKGKSRSAGRKIIVLTFISLDGVIQAPGGPKEDTSGGFKYGGWTFPYFDEEAGKEMEKQMAGKYDLLLGRKTYDIFSNYWPDHPEGWPQINRITKYVVSKMLKKPDWTNTKVLKGLDEIKKLKATTGSPLQVYGSGDMIQTLLKNNLVDELWLKIFPVSLGKGKMLFAKGTIPTSWKLISSSVTSSGVIFANYKWQTNKIETGTF